MRLVSEMLINLWILTLAITVNGWQDSIPMMSTGIPRSIFVGIRPPARTLMNLDPRILSNYSTPHPGLQYVFDLPPVDHTLLAGSGSVDELQ
jgi:hypothetical protein